MMGRHPRGRGVVLLHQRARPRDRVVLADQGGRAPQADLPGQRRLVQMLQPARLQGRLDQGLHLSQRIGGLLGPAPLAAGAVPMTCRNSRNR